MRNPCEDIIFSGRNVFVEKIYFDGKKLYHVFIKGLTHATCDSAYYDKEFAISRAKYLDSQPLVKQNQQ